MKVRIVHTLKAEPFSQWLSQRVKVYGGARVFAEQTEVDYNWICKTVNEAYKTVDLDKVDQILCKDGTAHIRDLYPDLYEEYE